MMTFMRVEKNVMFEFSFFPYLNTLNPPKDPVLCYYTTFRIVGEEALVCWRYSGSSVLIPTLYGHHTLQQAPRIPVKVQRNRNNHKEYPVLRNIPIPFTRIGIELLNIPILFNRSRIAFLNILYIQNFYRILQNMKMQQNLSWKALYIQVLQI